MSITMNPNLFYHLRKKMSKNLQLFELLFSKSDFTPLHKLFLCNGVKSLLLNKSSKSCRFFDIFFLKWQKRLVFIVTDMNVASRLRKIYCIKTLKLEIHFEIFCLRLAQNWTTANVLSRLIGWARKNLKIWPKVSNLIIDFKPWNWKYWIFILKFFVSDWPKIFTQRMF